MSEIVFAILVALGVFAWLLAGSAIVLGRNLTQSVMMGYVFVGVLCLALLIAGGGFLGIVLAIIAAVGLASIQVFGWMLVDVDRDHLAPTDGPTWIARVMAFLLLGGGLAILGSAIAPDLLERSAEIPASVTMSTSGIGRALFGRFGAAAVLLGLAVAAALLATMLLLRDDEGGH